MFKILFFILLFPIFSSAQDTTPVPEDNQPQEEVSAPVEETPSSEAPTASQPEDQPIEETSTAPAPPQEETVYRGPIDFRGEELFTEKILLIGSSKTIFILSNDSQKLTKGDFITLILENRLGLRALVAKVKDNRAGIKVLKLYDPDIWSKLSKNTAIQILIGDDSKFKKNKSPEENAKEDKEDLKSIGLDANDNVDTLFKEEDDGSVRTKEIDDKHGRTLETNHIVGFGWGLFNTQTALNQDGTFNEGKSNYNDYNFSYAYQISDNIYLEGMFNYTTMGEFPARGLNTSISSLALRAKYVFELPAYFYVMPFLGMRYSKIKSPDAGVQDISSPVSQLQLNNEIFAVEDALKKQLEFVGGATLLRRFVPGWYLKADLEISQVKQIRWHIGLCVEF
jgi:hypothetical protein